MTATSTPTDLKALIDLFRSRTGIAIAPERYAYAEEAVQRCMRRAGIATHDAYRARLQTDAGALDDLIAALTVAETYFFREAGHFLFIQHTVLPALQLQGPGRSIRMWSAACASGEEPYSLAILAKRQGLASRTKILATDISQHAIDRARRGTYRPWSLRGEGAAAARPYLTRLAHGYRIDERIQALVELRRHNLVTDLHEWRAAGIYDMDLILCRNVLIYFGHTDIARVARNLFESLAGGGWLITGPSDPPLGGLVPLEVQITPEGVFYRRMPQRASTVSDVRPAAEPLLPVHPEGDAHGLDDHRRRIEKLERSTASASTAPNDDLDGSGADAEARRAYTEGNYARAAELTDHRSGDSATAVLHVRALAHIDEARAMGACTEAVERFPPCVELRHIQGALLLSLGHAAAAEHALRRALYLDRTLAISHFTLGLILKQRGEIEAARRSFRNAYRLCAALPSDAFVPLADGERAGELAQAAAAEISSLGATEGTA